MEATETIYTERAIYAENLTGTEPDRQQITRRNGVCCHELMERTGGTATWSYGTEGDPGCCSRVTRKKEKWLKGCSGPSSAIFIEKRRAGKIAHWCMDSRTIMHGRLQY